MDGAPPVLRAAGADDDVGPAPSPANRQRAALPRGEDIAPGRPLHSPPATNLRGIPMPLLRPRPSRPGPGRAAFRAAGPGLGLAMILCAMSPAHAQSLYDVYEAASTYDA